MYKFTRFIISSPSTSQLISFQLLILQLNIQGNGINEILMHKSFPKNTILSEKETHACAEFLRKYSQSFFFPNIVVDYLHKQILGLNIVLFKFELFNQFINHMSVYHALDYKLGVSYLYYINTKDRRVKIKYHAKFLVLKQLFQYFDARKEHNVTATQNKLFYVVLRKSMNTYDYERLQT